jgi:hypothetical protein
MAIATNLSGVAESWDEAIRTTLTLALSQKERGQEFWLPSPFGRRAGIREFIPLLSNAIFLLIYRELSTLAAISCKTSKSIGAGEDITFSSLLSCL